MNLPTNFINMQMTGQNFSTAQLRNLSIQKELKNFLVFDETTNEPIGFKDTLIYVLPKHHYPGKVVCVRAEQAAEMIVDGKAVIPTDEQVKEYETELKLSAKAIQKQLDRQDLAKAMNRLVKD